MEGGEGLAWAEEEIEENEKVVVVARGNNARLKIVDDI